MGVVQALNALVGSIGLGLAAYHVQAGSDPWVVGVLVGSSAFTVICALVLRSPNG